MSIGVIGRKVGMTQVFAEDGTMVPVSVLAVEPNTVTLLRTQERDGYTAVQVGAGTARVTTKPRAGQLKDLPKVRDVREFRVDDVAEYEVGQTLDVSLFEDGESVDITGTSKGKGFAGAVWGGFPASGPGAGGTYGGGGYGGAGRGSSRNSPCIRNPSGQSLLRAAAVLERPSGRCARERRGVHHRRFRPHQPRHALPVQGLPLGP